MMKKFAAMLLTGVMAISLAACGGSSGASTSTDNAAAEPAAEETAAAYRGRMDIIRGIELGLIENQFAAGEKALAAYDYDFVIASFHCYRGEDIYKLDYAKRDRKALFEDFYLSVYEYLRAFKNYDIVGHFTILDRYIGTIFPLDSVEDIIRATLQMIIDDGKGIEINTSSHSYHMPVGLPRVEVLRLYRELGGEILTIGSDTHDLKRYGDHFDEAVETAKSLGFRYYTIYHARKPIFKKLP